MIDVQSRLETAFRDAIVAAFGSDFADVDPQIRASTNPTFGDYQANGAMPLAKRVGKNPREIAQAIIAKLDLGDDFEKVDIAGPGFINVRLSALFLSKLLNELSADPRVGAERTKAPDTVVIDYSAPNVAKEMHVGHLRSTIIGDAIARILSFQGHRVIRQNHLGDWGTQFGMLIEYINDLGWKPEDEHDIGDLNDLYKAAKAKFDADGAFSERARGRVVSLQSGDEATLKLWNLLIDESKKHFAAVYKTLGVLLEDGDYRGESFYNSLLASTTEDALSAEVARVSNGAVCLFPPGFIGQDGNPIPMILRKSDGGYGYDTTDLAALRFRVRELGATRLIYVTDSRQKLHFAMLFKSAELLNWLPATVNAEHVVFGTILGGDGKPFKTREGGTVRLSDLLEEAQRRAFDIVSAKSSELPEAERRAIAHAIGIGAVKYADLANDRIKDYVFDWERMLAFDGNTAPYLQNAYVRIQSIFRKAVEQNVAAGPIHCEADEERLLGLELLKFGEAVDSVARSLEPHRMSNYLYNLAALFHHFYEKCPVLGAENPALRASRLSLCALVARTIKTGLDLMGIEVVERM